MKAFFNLIDGIDIENPLNQLRLSVNDEFLIIEEKVLKLFRSVTITTHKIPLENIITTLVATESEIAEVNKSAIGRGVVGGLIFGPVGLVLGGLSGVGKKKTMSKKQHFIVSFLALSGDVKNITLVTASVSNDSITKGFNKYMIKTLKTVTPSAPVRELQLQNDDVFKQTEFML